VTKPFAFCPIGRFRRLGFSLYSVSKSESARTPDPNHDKPEALKAAKTKEKLDWRSFVGRGQIAREWNNPPTPTFYLIDHTGVIRQKWVGSPGIETMDLAIEKLVREVESK